LYQNLWLSAIATAKQNVGFLYCHAELAAPFRSLVRMRVSASQQ